MQNREIRCPATATSRQALSHDTPDVDVVDPDSLSSVGANLTTPENVFLPFNVGQGKYSEKLPVAFRSQCPLETRQRISF